MTFSEGQRAKHRTTGEVGTVVGTTRYGQLVRYRLALPTGLVDVAPADLVHVYDDPFELLANPPATVNSYDGWLRREAFRLLDAYRNDPTAALSNSRVEPKEHQISVAMRVLQKSQPRMILADEVGLGKTIEAGLVLKELRARGVLDRVLILTPASLVFQWQTELRSKFNEVFMLHDGAMLRDLRERHPESNPWNMGDQANVIASVQFARLDGQRDEIAAAHWDLVIVDEAHHARRTWDGGATLAYQLLETVRDRVGGLLLLTATPMQLAAYELYSMVELVEPGLYEDYWGFERAQGRIAVVNEQMSWLTVGPGSQEQQRRLEEVLISWSAPHDIRQADLDTHEGRADVAAWFETQHLLSAALVRNRKAQVGGFMTRKAHRLPVTPNPEETALADDVQAYLRREYARSPAFGLVLVTFQKLLASSSRALALALERRAEKISDAAAEDTPLTDDPELAEELEELISAKSHAVEAELIELEDLAARARAIHDSKLDALAAELDALFAAQPDQRVLVFTQYLGTLELIRERLEPTLRVDVFHGGLNRHEKETSHQAFKRRGQVMISSEAGGEGRNFQFCHILFNYDLPWNPMRVEQRIGRLDRVGQKHNVLIYNFGVRDTLDERILDVLEHRIRVFTESVGALEPILGDIEERIKKICLADAVTARREFDRYEVDLDERLRRARAQETTMRDFVMDARSFRRDEVSELLHAERMAGPEDLERFVLATLQRYSGSSRLQIQHDGAGVHVIDLPQILLRRSDRLQDDRYRGTFDYRIALEDESLEFFAFGHPLVDVLIDAVTEDGSVPPLAALQADEDAPGLAVDYEVRFTGVRERRELLTTVVGREVESRPIRFLLPGRPDAALPIPSLAPDEVERLAGVSRSAAGEEVERRGSLFSLDNEAHFDAERKRLEKLFRFQEHHFEQRIVRVEAQIRRLAEFGTESERRVIPALRGRIDQDRIRVAAVAEERDLALGQLEARRVPGEQIRILGVVAFEPATHAPASPPSLEEAHAAN